MTEISQCPHPCMSFKAHVLGDVVLSLYYCVSRVVLSMTFQRLSSWNSSINELYDWRVGPGPVAFTLKHIVAIHSDAWQEHCRQGRTLAGALQARSTMAAAARALQARTYTIVSMALKAYDWAVYRCRVGLNPLCCNPMQMKTWFGWLVVYMRSCCDLNWTARIYFYYHFPSFNLHLTSPTLLQSYRKSMKLIVFTWGASRGYISIIIARNWTST